MALFDKFTKKTETPFDPSTVLPEIMEMLTREGFHPEIDRVVRDHTKYYEANDGG